MTQKLQVFRRGISIFLFKLKGQDWILILLKILTIYAYSICKKKKISKLFQMLSSELLIVQDIVVKIYWDFIVII